MAHAVDLANPVTFTADEVGKILSAIKGKQRVSVRILNRVAETLNNAPRPEILVDDVGWFAREQPAMAKLYRLHRVQLPAVIAELQERKRVWEDQIQLLQENRIVPEGMNLLLDYYDGQISQYEKMYREASDAVQDAKPAQGWHRLAAFIAGVYFRIDSNAGWTRNGPAVAFVQAVLIRLTGTEIGKSAIETALKGVQSTGCGQLRCLLAPRACATHAAWAAWGFMP